MAGKKDVVEQALKLITGGSDDAAKLISSIQRSDPFPVDYIEPGSLRYKYEHPDTGSFMEIITRPKGARGASVIGLEVPEEYRGAGIGKALQERVLKDFPSLMGQVSSKAAAVNAYKAGRRPIGNPNATLEDVFKMIDEDSSVNLATEKNAGGPIREGYGPGGIIDDVVKLAGKVISGEGDEAAQSGIRAYHGSPHDFDKFDMSKIGTGEGAQAYGHGLYFAENEGVAKGYGDRLAGGPMGQHIYDDLLKITGNHGIASDSSLIDTIKRGGDLRQNLIELSKRKARSANDYDRETASFYANLAADEDFMKAVNDKKYNHMYEVNIAADPNTFLDWDKPLSEQPLNVKEALSPWGHLDAGGPAGDILKWDMKQGGNLSGYLRGKGIPGIKYLDAGSRGAGDGTRNYVVFDDKLISIIRKYGIAGASAMLGYNLMENLDANQARAATAADMDFQSQKQDKANGGSIREGYQTKGRVVGDVVEQALKLIAGTGPELTAGGIRAYHGSPHYFDRFDVSKIGTGEGAQAYGHGLYFAGKEDIAKYYRDRLTKPDLVRPDEEAVAAISPRWQEIVRELKDARLPDGRPTERSMELQNELDALNEHAIADTLARKPWLKTGHMYEVEIAADPNRLIDWNDPLKEQPADVRSAIMPFAEERADRMNKARREMLDRGVDMMGRPFSPKRLETLQQTADPETFTGENIYRHIQAQLGAGNVNDKAAEASQFLTEKGLHGIQYLDASSRGAGVIEPTKNFVIPEDKRISIIRRYADGGEVDDDVNDALRIAKDVGGGTTVMMEDAKGNKYDAQGNVIPQDSTGPNPQRTEAAPQQNVMFNTAPQNYSQDVQPFIDYAVTPIDRPGTPSEPDLVNVMRIATQVAAQGQPTDDRGQGNFARRRSETVRSLVGASPEGYQSDYKGPFSYNAGDTADLLNTLIDFSPYGALEYAHDIPYEAGRTGDYGTAAVEGGLGALMTTPGMALAGRGIKKGYELAKQFPKLTAGAIGAGAATTGSDEAEAGPARWFSKAVEAARAIPMNKMTGEQALAILRKGTSPEELRWMGADDFLTGQKSVSKDDLVAFLEKNRVQPKEIVLGGGDKPTRREDVRPDADIVAKYRDERDKLQQEYNDIRSRLKGETDFNKYEPLARAEGEKYRELNAITERMIDDQIARMGGLGLPTKYGPGSRYGDRFHTPGGKNYQETTFNIPPKEVELVEWPVIDVFGNVKARYDSKEAAERVARTSGSTVGEPRTTVIQKGYKSSHWPELNTLGHIRTQILEAELPGSNRPFKLFNVDEAQSDYAQDVRKYGLREENGENFSKKLNEFTQQMAERWVTQKAEKLYQSSPELFSGIEEARSGAMRLANQRGATTIAEELGVSDEFERLVAAEQRYRKGIEPAPYVTNTQHFTDFSIKKALDQAIDSGADYFTFTPGEVHADRYDLARDLSQIEYEPGDYGTYSISAIGKNGKNVLDKDMDIDEIEEYFGKEIAKKIKSDEGRKMEDRPYRDWRVLENEQIKAKGDAMVDAYNNIYKKRVEKVVKDATGKKITWEVLPTKTANGIVPRLGFRIDEDVKNARFSDFNKGGRVTGGNAYDNDSSVAHALALTSEY